jgi:hypothetical protein
MTHAAGDKSAFQPIRARNTLTHTVRTLLKGTGLDIRELASELVISHPGHPVSAASEGVHQMSGFRH